MQFFRSFPPVLLLVLGSAFAQDGRPPAVPLAQDFTVIHRRDDPKSYVEGCGIIAFEDGELLAVVPVIPRGSVPKKGPCTVHLKRSKDRGESWTQVSTLPYYSAVPFLHDGALYLFLCTKGSVSRNDDLHLVRSTDRGETWSDPVTLFEGHFWNCQTGIVIRDNHIYWAIDDLYESTRVRSPRAIVGDLSAPMNPDSWRIFNLIPFPGMPSALERPGWKSRKDGIPASPDLWLEPNIVDVGGRLRMLACVKFQSQTATNLCAVFDLSDDGKKLQLDFTQFHSMPGGHLQFAIVQDPVSGLYWATTNLAVDSQESLDAWPKARQSKHFTGSGGNDRRFLMLHYSLDALNWFQAGCIARAESPRESFMYGTPAISGDDLYVVSRTSSSNASDQHDADLATLHRIENFRSLALDLRP